jgi:hypothetical protein
MPVVTFMGGACFRFHTESQGQEVSRIFSSGRESQHLLGNTSLTVRRGFMDSG